jgi:hypothetical protein
MAKRVTLTEKMRQEVMARCGTDVDLNKIVFYQARGISTEPIHQGTLYDKGILERQALVDMLNLVNDPLNTVTLQTMHNQEVLPTGRVFYAELVDEQNTGHSALYTLFGVSTNHPEIISDVDNGIIDEVSYSFMPKKILCNKCNKDFLDNDVDLFDFITGTCPECGAVMGKDDAHVIVPGVESVRELSLVTRGAAKHAKILDSMYQMAMSDKNSPVITLTKKGVKKDLCVFNLCSTIYNKEVEMNPEELKAAILAATEPLSNEVKDMKVSLASLGQEKAALEAAKNEAENAKAALEEEKASLSEEKARLETELADSKKEIERLKGVEASFDEEIKKVLVAAGLSDTIPEDTEGKAELLKKAHLTLANIPVNGVSAGADRGINNNESGVDFSVYKVR